MGIAWLMGASYCHSAVCLPGAMTSYSRHRTFIVVHEAHGLHREIRGLTFHYHHCRLLGFLDYGVMTQMLLQLQHFAFIEPISTRNLRFNCN